MLLSLSVSVCVSMCVGGDDDGDASSAVILSTRLLVQLKGILYLFLFILFYFFIPFISFLVAPKMELPPSLISQSRMRVFLSFLTFLVVFTHLMVGTKTRQTSLQTKPYSHEDRVANELIISRSVTVMISSVPNHY